MAWESVPGSRKDVATGCNAEHEQLNRHLEHQEERPEGPKDKRKSRRSSSVPLPPSQDPSPGQSTWKAAEQGQLRAGSTGVHTWEGTGRRIARCAYKSSC